MKSIVCDVPNNFYLSKNKSRQKIFINTNFHRLQMPRELFQFDFPAIFKQTFFVEKISPISLRQGRASLLTTSMPRELTSLEQTLPAVPGCYSLAEYPT